MLMPYMKSKQLWLSPVDPNNGLDPRWPTCVNFSDFSATAVPCDNQVEKKSYTANAALIPRKRRSIDPAYVISSTAVDQPAGTIIFGTFSQYKSCVYDSSNQQNNNVVNKSHRPTNAAMTQSGGKMSFDNAADFSVDIYAVTPAVANAAFNVCKTQESGALPHIKYINPKTTASGSNYSFADGHSKNIRFEATLNPESFMWGKAMYTAGGKAFLDQNGQPVR
jgi:prepilin-type processing-associated H-X9-DG protein